MSEKIQIKEWQHDDIFIKTESTLADLIVRIPYLINPRTRFIPPNFIIQQKLKKNHFQLGYEEVHWDYQTFDFSDKVMATTIESLLQNGFKTVEIPSWVNDELTWDAFELQVCRGVPPQEYIPLAKERNILSKKLAELEDSQDENYFIVYRKLTEILDKETSLLEKNPIKSEYLFKGENQ